MEAKWIIQFGFPIEIVSFILIGWFADKNLVLSFVFMILAMIAAMIVGKAIEVQAIEKYEELKL